MTVNKQVIFDALLSRWGYDHQLLTAAAKSSEFSASCSRYVSHSITGDILAERAADTEIIIEQLRYYGMGDLIDISKKRALEKLAERTGTIAEPVSMNECSARSLMEEAMEQAQMGSDLYLDLNSSNRLAAARLRKAVSLFMQAAQIMIREQQYRENHQ
ncbi:hypothetical protein GW742_18010 [Citrobacter freundii]|nr:hypothetical protein [Citrobacter freundii]MBC6508318.1 hypothetical protein [Citrobacter freundii]